MDYRLWTILPKTKLKIKQQQRKRKHHTIGYDHRTAFDGKSVYQPHNGTGNNDQDHPNTEVADTFRLPGFIDLRNKSNGG